MSDRIQATPKCAAMVLCERVETDLLTRRMNLHGLVLTTHMSRQDLAIYFDLVQGHGRYVVRLDLVHLETGGRWPLPQSGSALHLDRGHHFVFSLSLKNMSFGQPGGQRVQLYMNEELIHELRFVVSPNEGLTQRGVDPPPIELPPGG